MLTIREQKLVIYFGDASDGISKHEHCTATNHALVDIQPFKSVAQKISVPRLSLLHQTHGTAGAQIVKTDISFTADGDYMITNQTDAGLGILTADCVPLILYDSKNQAIAAIHAGWRGAVAGIVPKAFEHMQSAYQTDARDVRVFVGPSAKVCCYQVQEDFACNIRSEFEKKVMIKKEEHWYFDTVQLIKLHAEKVGISTISINTQYNSCTVCDHRFFSHRRQAAAAGRQITIACLH